MKYYSPATFQPKTASSFINRQCINDRLHWFISNEVQTFWLLTFQQWTPKILATVIQAIGLQSWQHNQSTIHKIQAKNKWYLEFQMYISKINVTWKIWRTRTLIKFWSHELASTIGETNSQSCAVWFKEAMRAIVPLKSSQLVSTRYSRLTVDSHFRLVQIIKPLWSFGKSINPLLHRTKMV